MAARTADLLVLADVEQPLHEAQRPLAPVADAAPRRRPARRGHGGVIAGGGEDAGAPLQLLDPVPQDRAVVVRVLLALLGTAEPQRERRVQVPARLRNGFGQLCAQVAGLLAAHGPGTLEIHQPLGGGLDLHAADARRTRLLTTRHGRCHRAGGGASSPWGVWGESPAASRNAGCGATWGNGRATASRDAGTGDTTSGVPGCGATCGFRVCLLRFRRSGTRGADVRERGVLGGVPGLRGRRVLRVVGGLAVQLVTGPAEPSGPAALARPTDEPGVDDPVERRVHRVPTDKLRAVLRRADALGLEIAPDVPRGERLGRL